LDAFFDDDDDDDEEESPLYDTKDDILGGIYPLWPASFEKRIPNPQGRKRVYFKKAQEATRTDTERAFRVDLLEN
jgi:negative regulator of replication initiation